MRSSTMGLLVALATTVPAAASGQEATCPPPAAGVIHVRGEVERALDVSAEDLATLPRQTIQVDDEGTTVAYEGVAVRDILTRAGVPMESLRGRQAASVLVAEARDGYRAVYALGELDEQFSGRLVLLADRRDGAALSDDEGPFRIVMRGESRHSRWIRQVSCLRVVRP